MNIIDFFTRFQDEEVCEQYLISHRWPDGMRCQKCNGAAFFPHQPRPRAYECKACRHFNSPTAGTVFHKTRTPLQAWFLALFITAFDKRGLSAQLLAEQIGVDYNTAWAMLHKIRRAMAKRDAQYLLAGNVEMDEMFLGTPTEGEKRGRGTEQTPILVAVSFVSSNEGEQMAFARLKAVKHVTAQAVVTFAKRWIKLGSRVRTDGLAVYPALEKHGFTHDPDPVGRRKAHLVLPHVHTYISNLRSFVQGTYHGLPEKHLQQYLDEFCYRFNRRQHHDELFDRLLLACLEKDETPVSALVQ